MRGAADVTDEARQHVFGPPGIGDGDLDATKRRIRRAGHRLMPCEKRAGPEFSLEAASAGQRLAYRFREGTVEVLYWAGYDRPRGVDPTAYPLLDGVTAFQLAYLTKDGAWVDTWPRTGESELPRAVKVDLTLASGETIERWLALR